MQAISDFGGHRVAADFSARGCPNLAYATCTSAKKAPPPRPSIWPAFALDQRPSKLCKVIHLNRHPICWVNREYSFT